MEFKEDFLQVVWKYQYFDKKELKTTDGQPIEVKKIGHHNFHEGPDFLEAQIRIGKLDYYGHVEVHRKASDWKTHDHDADFRYNSVILHVVWDNDQPIKRPDNSLIPTLELKGKVLLDVVRNYEKLSGSKLEILCGPSLDGVPEIIKFSMLEKALLERIEIKSQAFEEILEATKNDWEESTFRWLFRSFGFKTNSEPMYLVSESIPYKIIQKHVLQPKILEALLFGQADLIPEEPVDEYGKFLRKEYLFYQKKYDLKKNVHLTQWKLMGVRPQNFPTIRLAQLSAILEKNQNLFSAVLDLGRQFGHFKDWLSIDIPEYWQHHYKIGFSQEKRLSRKISKNSLYLLAINFLVPIWYAYGKSVQDEQWKDKCFDLLQEIPAEDNYIIQKYFQHGWKAVQAFDSQGMLGLYHQYCKPKNCLNCKIGQNLLKPEQKAKGSSPL